MTHADAERPAEARAVAQTARVEPPAALPDDQNPAIIDARRTFFITVISVLLFIGSVILFIL